MQSDKWNKPGYILGGNLVALLIYAIISSISEGNYFYYAIFIGIHFIVAIIMAIALRKWVWFLSGLLILIVGFSTCVQMINSSRPGL